MKLNTIIITAALILFISTLTSDALGQVSRLLNIPGRLQWDNANGYCGETSIQMIGLYYGNYISQDFCRNVAGGEVLIGDENGEAALNSFSFTYDEWDYNQTTPQYQNYLVWLKQELYHYHPVIITVYVQGMSDPDYDHIIPAIGFSSADTSLFHNSDELMFNDCYDSTYYTRTFQSIWDTRSMTGNGATYEYCVPKNVDYGCAVTGIKDVLHETKPVHLSINRWDEPNVTLGEQAVMLHGTITIDSLVSGTKYALLRYNDYTTLPSSGFKPLSASGAVYFIATGSSQTFTDNFMSNTAVFFRCIPYNFSDVHEVNLDENKVMVYPVPAKDYLTVESTQNSTFEIFNDIDQIVMSQTSPGSKTTIDLKELKSGVYIIKVKTEKEIIMKRFVKE